MNPKVGLAVGVVALGLALGVWVRRDDLAAYANASESLDRRELAVYDFRASGLATRESEGWIELPGAGLSVLPGVEAALEIPIPHAPPDRTVILELLVQEPPDFDVALEVSRDAGKTTHTVHRGASVAGKRVELGRPGASPTGNLRARLLVRRAAESSGKHVPAVIAIRVESITATHLSALPAALFPAFLAAILFALGRALSERRAVALLLGVTGASAGALLLAWAPDLAPPHLGWLAGLAALATLVVAWRRDRPEAGFVAALAGIAFWGLFARWDALEGVALAEELEPDALHYLQLANRLGWPYDTSYREPFLVWTEKVASLAFGRGHLTPRMVSVAFGAIAIVLVYALGARLFDRAVGLVAAFGMATSAYLVETSVRGLRLELYVCLIELLALVVLAQGRSLARHIAAGLVGAALVATRLSSLGLVAIGLAVVHFTARDSRRLRTLPLLVLPAVLVAGPHLFHNYRETGNAMDSVDRHLRYYRNREFAGATGHPTFAEVERDPYGGPDVNTWSYLFGLHTPRQLASGTTRGLASIVGGDFARRTYFREEEFRRLLCLAGLLLCFFSTRGRLVPVALVLVLGPVAFVVGALQGAEIVARPEAGFDPRLAYPIAPLLEIAIALAVLFPARLVAETK